MVIKNNKVWHACGKTKTPRKLFTVKSEVPFPTFHFSVYASRNAYVWEGSWGRMDIGTCMAEALPCSADAITILFVNQLYSNTK